MSILKFLFGDKTEAKDVSPKNLGEDDYKGFFITALEMLQGQEYQLSGTIEKEIDGEVKIKNFIRADRLSSKEEALKFIHKKGRQIIDEQGDALFDNSHI